MGAQRDLQLRKHPFLIVSPEEHQTHSHQETCVTFVDISPTHTWTTRDREDNSRSQEKMGMYPKNYKGFFDVSSIMWNRNHITGYDHEGANQK